MKNMRMIDSMRLLICLLVLTVSEVQGTDFISSPGNVSVLENRSLILSWTHAIPDQDIEWCYYQFRSPTTSPDEFLGWDNNEKKRLNISDNHIGWRFINEQYPCLGGIKRDHAESHHAGSYRFYVITAQGEEHVNQNSVVTVFTGSELMYTLQISDEEMTGSVAHQAVLETMEMESIDSDIKMSIRLGKDFPSNITLQAHYKDGSKAESLQSCPMSISCSTEVPAKNGLIQLSAAIESRIQGVEDVRLQQPILISDKSAIIAREKKWKMALIVIVIVSVVIIPIIGGVVGLICFLKFKKKKSKNEESRRLLKSKADQLDDTKSKLTKVQEEITDLLKQITDLTEEKNTLEESNQVLSHNLETSEKASKETQLALNALDENYCKLQNELEEKKRECTDLSGSLYIVKNTKGEDDKTIKSLQDQILILKSDLADKNNDIATRKQGYDELYLENETNKKHVGRLKDELKEKKESTEQLVETMNSLKQEKQKLQNDVITLAAKQKGKGKQPDTNINPRISKEPLVHKNAAFGQDDSIDARPDSVQQTGIMSGQNDDQQSIETATDVLTETSLLKNQVLDEKHGDPFGEVANTQQSIPQETPDVPRRDEPTLHVVNQTGDICVQKDKTMLLSVAIEDNLLVKATWYHGESEIWGKQKYKTGSDGNMHYLMVYHAGKSDGGDYTCHLKAVRSNLEDNCVRHVTIKDNVDFKFDGKPKDVSCKIGSSVSIKASMKHQGSVEFIWLRNGIIVPEDFIETAQDNRSVLTTLSIDHFSEMDAGEYHIFALAGEHQNCCTSKLMIK